MVMKLFYLATFLIFLIAMQWIVPYGALTVIGLFVLLYNYNDNKYQKEKGQTGPEVVRSGNSYIRTLPNLRSNDARPPSQSSCS